MGGTESKTWSNIVNDIAVDVISRNVNKCVTTTNQEQTIGAAYVGGSVDISGINMTQSSTIDSTCILRSDTQNDITTQLGVALAESASAAGESVLSALGSTKSEAAANITNALKTNIQNVNMQEAYTASSQKQQYLFGIVEKDFKLSNLNMNQTVKLASESLMGTTAYSKVINEVKNVVDQQTVSKETNPISNIIGSVGNAFSGAMAPFAIVGGLVALVVIGIILFMMFKK